MGRAGPCRKENGICIGPSQRGEFAGVSYIHNQGQPVLPDTCSEFSDDNPGVIREKGDPLSQSKP